MDPLKMWTIEKKRQYDGLAQVTKDSMRNACVMLLCMSVFLAVLYSQYRVYIYSDPYQSILKAIDTEEIDSITRITDMWPWLLGLLQALGGNTFKQIESNCGPNDPNSQSVIIDGKSYTLNDPDFQKSACSDKDYVTSLPDSSVFLTGNFQLVLLGLFTQRAHPVYPNSNALAANLDETTSLYDEVPKKLSATKDWNIVNVCDAPWPTSSVSSLSRKVSTQCVLEDNFSDNVGSTFGWEGSVVTVGGKSRFVFSNSSYVISRKDSEFQILYPCYSLSEEDDIVSGNPNFNFTENSDTDYGVTNCGYTWISRGASVRSHCLDMSGSQPSAMQLYAASNEAVGTTDDLMHKYFGCYDLENFTAVELSNVYLQSTTPIDHEISDTLYGVFLPVVTEHEFLVESHRLSTLLFGHNFVDVRKTRNFRLSIVLRNVEKDSMYYTNLHVDINVNSNGNVVPTYSMSHVPIPNFIYGTGNYPWYFREIAVLESMLLFLFCCFLFRELKQIAERIVRVYEKIKRKKITDSQVSDPKMHSQQKVAEVEVVYKNDEPSNKGQDEHVNESNGIADKNVAECGENDVENQNGRINVEGNRVISVVNPDRGSIVYDLIDWATIACFLSSMVIRIIYIHEADALDHAIKTGLLNDSVDQKLDTIVNKFIYLEGLFRDSNYLALFLCFVGFTQFFRYLSFDKRLGIVTRTITASFIDLLPVMLILCFILIAYSILGVALYGHQSQYFTSFGESLTTLSLIVLGEVAGPYYEMQAISQYDTILYYWSFVILIGFILLNMVLAIIFKVYDDAYGEIMDSSKKSV